MPGSLTRHINFLLAAYSYLKSSVTGKVTTKGMPVSIGVELTNNCNLNCPECVSGSGQMKRERGFMEPELFDKVINELNPYLYNINLYFQGEPMLHPHFFSFIRHSRKINTVVSTNGHFLSADNSERIAASGLTKLIISLDGIDDESYSAYRVGGSVNTVLDGIRNITEAKKRLKSPLKIEIQLLVNSLNEHQIPLIKQLARRTKTSLCLKSMQIINKDEIEYWLPKDTRFSRYRLKDGEYVIKSSLPDRCARLWFNPVITWDGKVIPCCFDKNAEYIMGDLNIDTFKEIWDGSKYRIFRKSILSGRRMIGICRNCTSGIQRTKY